MQKFCGKCQLTKDVSDFYKNRARYDGYSSQCKSCSDVTNNIRPRRIQQIHEWQERNRQRVQANVRAYGRNNRLVKNQIEGKRRAQIYGTQTEKVNYKDILDRDGWICHICKQPVTQETLNFDHVFPLVKGGGHTADNIKVAHAVCNARKGAKV